MTRVLRLTLLALDIVEAILDERQGPEMTMARLLNPFPAEWTEQRAKWQSGGQAAGYTLGPTPQSSAAYARSIDSFAGTHDIHEFSILG